MSLLATDIARLIHHHLLKEGYESSANNLISECPHLKGLKPVKQPYKLPRLLGLSLADLFESYFETKENVIEELELLESVVFREHDSLPFLTKTLVENLKSPTLSKSVHRDTCSIGVNTENKIKSGSGACDASVNTDSIDVPKSCDASVNTDPILIPENCDACINTDPLCVSKTCDSSVNTGLIVGSSETYNTCLNTQEKIATNDVANTNPPTATERPEVHESDCDANVNSVWNQQHAIDQENSHALLCPEQLIAAETVDFSLVYDRLLENREFQEKIAENINKKKAQVVLPHTDNPKGGSTASSQDLDTVIKAIVAETQADPAFDNFLKDCIGIDSEDQTSVGTPDSIAPHDSEPNIAPYSSENQENCMVSENLLKEPTLVEPPIIPSSFFTLQNSDVTGSSSVINTLNSVAIVTSSGQITLVPTIISAMPGEEVSSETVPPAVTRRVKKKQTIVPRKAPVRIAPKPIFTLTIPAPDSDYDQLPTTACEAELGVVEQDIAGNPQNQQQSLDPNLLTVETNESSPGPSKMKPIMKIKNRPLAKSRRTKNSKIRDPILRRITNPRPPEKNLTSNLAALLKIAEEYRSSTMDVPNQQSIGQIGSSESPDIIFSTPAPDSSGFVTTPTSTRRRSHVRQLNFGESPELPTMPAVNSPADHSKRSDIPWDLALRNAFAAPPPPDTEIFATPKGKAKRKRKSSPMPVTIDVVVTPEMPSNEATFSTASSTFSNPPAQASITNSVSTEETAISAPVTEEASQPCGTSESIYADLVAASILHEMANTPIVEETQKEPSSEKASDGMATQCVVSTVNLSQFGTDIVSHEDHVVQHFTLPVLATPRKEITDTLIGSCPTHSVPPAVLCDGQSNSVSFGAWDGEIPRTPQIRMDLTNSTSPFQVSLTKGFRFLPTADSPSLAVPSTPCILEAGNSSTSIETPYTGFYQFPSVLSTPRLEALRQEIMESPSKSLSMTVISPTQVVLGRPTPYFVPSGERAQGPVMNQIATPEHIPEPDKLDRTRRSSTEMDPLQLEESNDASDAAAALMCKAAENVAAALHPPTPYKTDQTLENDLIDECLRLEDVPSVEKVKLHNQRLIELFGEDSTNLSESNGTIPSALETVMEVALAQSTPIITKQTTRKSRRTAPKKSIPIDESGSSGCARVQVYPGNPQACRRQSKRRSNSSKASTSPENETIIQELLAMSRLNNSREKQSPLRKRKRRSHPLNREKHGFLDEENMEKRSTPKESNLSIYTKTIETSTSVDVDEFVSISCASSPSSSKEEVDVVELVEMVEAPMTSPKKTGRSKNAKKAREKSAISKVTSEGCSSNSFGMATRRTPVKLFKSAPPFARKAISYRQSAGVKKTPTKISPGESFSVANVSDKGTSLEKNSIGADDMPVTVTLANDDQPIEDLVRVVETDCPVPDKVLPSLITGTDENADGLLAAMQQSELPVATGNIVKETAALEEVRNKPSATSPVIFVEDLPVASVCGRIATANTTSAADIEESGADVVIGPENNPIAMSTQEEAPASPADILLPSNSSKNAEELNSLTSKPISDVLCERQHCLADLSSPTALETEPANTAEIVLSHEDLEIGTEERNPPPEAIKICEPEETLRPTEALSNVNIGVALANSVGCVLPQDGHTVKSNQKFSSSTVTAAKEKTNRSNPKLQNYLRLSSFNDTPDIRSIKRKPSPPDATALSTESSSPANPRPHAIAVHDQLPLQETTVFMHKDLVNKIRKQMRLSKEVGLYSQ